MLAYSVFLNPRLYWIPNSLPFLKLGVTEFAPDFRISTLPGISLCLLGPLMKRLGELIESGGKTSGFKLCASWSYLLFHNQSGNGLPAG